MSLIATILVLVVATANAEAQAVAPVLSCRDGVPYLALPGDWQAALSHRFPGFHQFAFGDYHRYVQYACEPLSPTAPFAVIGDFDLDGKADVAFEGQDSDSARIIVIFSANGHPSVRSLWVRAALDPHTTLYDGDPGLWWQLTTDPYASPSVENAPVSKWRYVFQVRRVEHGELLVFWDGARFRTRDIPPGD